MRLCEWEGEAFDDAQFRPYRGRIYLHWDASPKHLTNGQLPDGPSNAYAEVGGAAATGGGAVGGAEFAPLDRGPKEPLG